MASHARSRPLLFSSLLAWIVMTVALAAQEPTVDPAVVESLTVLRKHEELAKKLKPGDVKAAQELIDGIDPVAEKLQEVEDKTHPEFITAAKLYQELRTKIVEVANQPKTGTADLKALHQDVIDAFDGMKRVKLEEMKEEKTRRHWEERIASFKVRHKELGDPDSENVRLIAANILKLDIYLESVLGQVEGKEGSDGDPERPLDPEEIEARMAKKRADSADVQAKVESLKQKYFGPGAVPEALRDPLTPDFVLGWAARLRLLRVSVPKDLEQLKGWKGRKDVDHEQLDSTIHFISTKLPSQLNELENAATRMLDARVDDGLKAARLITATDASNQERHVERILGEGGFEKKMEELQDGLFHLEIALAFDQGLGRKGGPDRLAQERELDFAIKRLQDLTALAVDRARMPKSASSDAKLLAAYEEVKKNEKYGFGEVLRAVVSTAPSRKEKKEGWVEPGTSRATISLYDYAWDEFEVTTAEREGEDIWLYRNKLKFYHAGDSTTPVKRWIVSRRFRTTRILEANLD